MNITNQDLHNETILFIKYFIYEKNKIIHNTTIQSPSFNSRLATFINLDSLDCVIRIIKVADIHIEIFNKHKIKLSVRINGKLYNIENNKNLVKNNIIKIIYSFLEEVNEKNPIKTKLLNIKNF